MAALTTCEGNMAINPMLPPIEEPLIVRVSYDGDLECPTDSECTWSLYSLCRRHTNFITPSKDDEFGLAAGEMSEDLRKKFKSGLAHWLSYYEHGNCWWGRSDGYTPAGVEFTWDGRRKAGLLVWEHDPSEIGAKTYKARARDADAFLEAYSCWANGDGFWYSIETRDGDIIDSCGGFYGNNVDEMLRDHMAPNLLDREFEVEGDGADLEGKLRIMVEELWNKLGKRGRAKFLREKAKIWLGSGI
jgi:hypothetical protein